MEESTLKEMVFQAYHDCCMEVPNNIPEIDLIVNKVLGNENIDRDAYDEYELQIKNILEEENYTYLSKGKVNPKTAVVINVW
ncbi:hypothetical protein COA01_16105 [Bacillus cereus]|uniref:hypothetical protein n=1 Tax=Bacillus cereus TaxID=1396 RepID=UPI000BFE3207|nr:hypothetical protein [Bacillus cereus]PGP21061.1 hypothetical protein COA01_16105 [Bacillus cereus]